MEIEIGRGKKARRAYGFDDIAIVPSRRTRDPDGVFTRYEDAEEQLARIALLPKEEATREMQAIYQEPVKPELIRQRIEEIKESGVVTAASLTPQKVRQFSDVALDA